MKVGALISIVFPFLLHLRCLRFTKCNLHVVFSYVFLSITLDIQTNECLENNGGCWQDKAANITACKVPPVVLGLFFENLDYQFVLF